MGRQPSNRHGTHTMRQPLDDVGLGPSALALSTVCLVLVNPHRVDLNPPIVVAPSTCAFKS